LAASLRSGLKIDKYRRLYFISGLDRAKLAQGVSSRDERGPNATGGAMIADLLRKGLAWARGFFWVAESSTDHARTAKQQASSEAAAGETKAERAGDSASGLKSTGQRRSAAAKTSKNKRGTKATKRATSQNGGAAAKTAKPKSTPSQGAAPKGAGARSSAPKANGPKSTGPGAADADPAKPGDLSEIKGIGPAIKTKLAQLGIKSFADLAGADAGQVAKSLDQRTVTPERVRSWIAEAKKRS